MRFLFFKSLDETSVFHLCYCENIFHDTKKGYILVDVLCDRESPNEIERVCEKKESMRLNMHEDDGQHVEYIVSFTGVSRILDCSKGIQNVYYKLEFDILEKSKKKFELTLEDVCREA